MQWLGGSWSRITARSVKRSAGLAAGLLLVSGCPQSLDPTTVVQPVRVGDEACALLGPAGGEIVSGDLSVLVSAGALGEETEVCITARTSEGPFEALSPALAFAPELDLAIPAQVRFPLPGNAEPSVFQNRGGTYFARDNVRDGAFIEFSLPSLKSVYLGMTCEDCAPARSKVDLLAVVDNSGSMSEEQEMLRQALPGMTQVLLTGDLDGDGDQDVPAVESLNVAVTSTTMGLDATVPNCPRDGDDGAFLDSGCGGGAFVHWDGTAPATDVYDAMQCRVSLGIDGCGFEQPFEAILRGVTPSTSDIVFRDGPGIGDGFNAGFIRDDAALAILLLTDEDDCSANDHDLYEPSSTSFPGDLNLRCFLHADSAVHPIARYLDGILALKERPGDLIFGTLTGIPQGTDGMAPAEILDHPEMLEVPDPSSPSRLAPVCQTESGMAMPGIRNVSLVKELSEAGAHGVVGSICTDDLAPMLERFGRAVAAAIEGR